MTTEPPPPSRAPTRTLAGTRAAIGLGGNLGDVPEAFRHAADRLDAAPGCRVLAASSLYQTAPLGPVAQPPYLNAALLLNVTLGPHELLGLLLAIERDRGRDRLREERWGPRTLDLDLLLYRDELIDTPDLKVPHPRLRERLFVLEPLAEIAPELIVPGTDSPVAVLAARLRGVQRVERLALTWRTPSSDAARAT
jgi:2-amino-4-hydroxy-6-hydroxymethyldihydropteridine diphosphokinase